MNEILLRRKNKVIVQKGNETSPDDRYVVTIMKNVEALGYTFSKELFEILQTWNKEEADVIFDVNEGITPYDIEIIAGEYL